MVYKNKGGITCTFIIMDLLFVRERMVYLHMQLKLYSEDAGWSNDNIPSWQIEKFTIAFENSTWAFTIWDEEEMIAMVRVISDGIMVANIVNLVVKCEYRGKGLGKKLVALCLQKLPHGDWFAHTSASNFDFYRSCGFEVRELSRNGTCAYYGYQAAKRDGHR